jgi:hypothetical protein
MDEPIITTQEETVHVNPQLNAQITSPSQRKELDDSFQDFCAEQDAKEGSAPPEVPAPEAPEEPVSEKPAPEAKPRTRKAKEKVSAEAPIPEVEAESPPDDPDDAALEAMEPHPQSSAQTRGNFRELKNSVKAARRQAKIWQNNLAPALQELGCELSNDPELMTSQLQAAATRIRELKNGALPEPVQHELKELRALAVSVGVLRSADFTRNYVAPRDSLYHETIEEMAQYFDASEQEIKEKFLDPLKKDFTVAQLPPEWWSQQTELMTKAPGPIKRKIERKIADLLLLQEKHDKVAREFAASPESFHSWQEQQAIQAGEAWKKAVETRVEKSLKEKSPHYYELRRRVLDGDKTAITEFAPAEQQFRNVLQAAQSGPDPLTDLAVEFVESQRRLAELADVEDRLKEAEDDNDKLRDELKKQRKAKDAPFRNRNVATKQQAPPALPHSARKSLQSAFDRWEP